MQSIMEHQLGARRGNTTAGHRDVVVRRMARQELVAPGHTCFSCRRQLRRPQVRLVDVMYLQL